MKHTPGPMSEYVAWLNGCSVAMGKLSQVESKAIEIFNSKLWQENEGDKETNLRITRGGRQLFVKSIILLDFVVF